LNDLQHTRLLRQPKVQFSTHASRKLLCAFGSNRFFQKRTNVRRDQVLQELRPALRDTFKKSSNQKNFHHDQALPNDLTKTQVRPTARIIKRKGNQQECLSTKATATTTSSLARRPTTRSTAMAAMIP
jgi:hypothetical protein